MLRPVVGPTDIATPFDDKTNATDLQTCEQTAKHIGLRVRDAAQYPPDAIGNGGVAYRDEITIRGRLSNGCETEMDKIMRGKCDLMMYAFALNGHISEAALFDMHVFRARISRLMELGVARPWQEKKNKDGGSWLFIFTVPVIFEYGRGIVHSWRT